MGAQNGGGRQSSGTHVSTGKTAGTRKPNEAGAILLTRNAGSHFALCTLLAAADHCTDVHEVVVLVNVRVDSFVAFEPVDPCGRPVNIPVVQVVSDAPRVVLARQFALLSPVAACLVLGTWAWTRTGTCQHVGIEQCGFQAHVACEPTTVVQPMHQSVRRRAGQGHGAAGAAGAARVHPRGAVWCGLPL